MDFIVQFYIKLKKQEKSCKTYRVFPVPNTGFFL